MMRRTMTTRHLSNAANSAQKNRKKVDCAVYGCGISACGALAIPKLMKRNGDGEVERTEVNYPKRIPFFNTHGIKLVSSGFGFSLFASQSKLYGAGLNNKFQIGGEVIGGQFQEYYISAKKINIPPGDILEISSGRAHSLIRTSSGVYAIGDNNFGQCGRNPEESEVSVGSPDKPLLPLNVPTDKPIVSIHCSLDTSFLVDSDGNVFSFGLNEDGQCGNGEYGVQWTPRKVTGDIEGVKVEKISGSSDTLLAVGEKEVFIWGQTEFGQTAGTSDEIQLSVSRRLNLSSSIGPIDSAASTSTSIIVRNTRGEVFVWGVGVLGMGPDADRLKRPTQMDQPLFDGKEITKIYAGNSAMAAINSSDRLFVWGENRFASLGLGHSKRQLFPYQVFLPGDVKTAALGPDHSLFLMH
uniref:Uncharacterized protein n=1 Tax=Caenorhabditis japonica TaxID=281687 RepID=A0A8R1DQ46_CAEJA